MGRLRGAREPPYMTPAPPPRRASTALVLQMLPPPRLPPLAGPDPRGHPRADLLVDPQPVVGPPDAHLLRVRQRALADVRRVQPAQLPQLAGQRRQVEQVQLRRWEADVRRLSYHWQKSAAYTLPRSRGKLCIRCLHPSPPPLLSAAGRGALPAARAQRPPACGATLPARRQEACAAGRHGGAPGGKYD